MLVRFWRALVLSWATVGLVYTPATAEAAGRYRRTVVYDSEGTSVATSEGGTTTTVDGEVIVSDETGASGEELPQPASQNPLFANYYTVPGVPGTPAQLYLSPRPTPPLVGHTYITYPPVMPHEYLYRHRRTYASTNPDGSRTNVRVRWGYTPFHQVWRTPRVTQKPKVDPTFPPGQSLMWWRVNPAFRD